MNIQFLTNDRKLFHYVVTASLELWASIMPNTTKSSNLIMIFVSFISKIKFQNNDIELDIK